MERGGGGEGAANDIPCFIFGTVSKEAFAISSQVFLARIVAHNNKLVL